MSGRTIHDCGFDLMRQALNRLPLATRIDQVAFHVDEDRRSLTVEMFYNGTDESLTSSFTLPPELRDQPLDREAWEARLHAAICNCGTRH